MADSKLLQSFFDQISSTRLTFREVRLWLLSFFVLTMPLVIFLGNTEYGYTKTIYTIIFISLLIAIWATEAVWKKELKVAFTRLTYPVLGWVAIGLMSAINASSIKVVLQSLALLIFFYLFYLLIVNTVENFFDTKLLLISLLLSALGATIYGLLQYYGVAAGPHGLTPGPSSIISTMGNRNYLGGFLSYLFLPCALLVILTRSKLLKGIILMSLAPIFMIFFPIGARGAWLSLIGSTLVVGIGVMIYRLFSPFRGQALWFVALCLVLISGFVFGAAPGPLNSVVGVSDTNGQPASEWGIFTPVVQPIVRELVKQGGARIQDWYIGWEMLKAHPFLGVGLGNYKIKFLKYRARFLNTERGQAYEEHIPRGAQAHNEYVQFAAETGGLGIAMIVTSLLTMFWIGVHRLRMATSSSVRLLTLGLLGGIGGFLIHSAVSFPAHLPVSSLTFALFFGLINSGVIGDRSVKGHFRNPGVYILAGLIVLFVMVSSIFAYRDWRANILRGKGVTQLKMGHYYLAKSKLQQSASLDFRPRHTYYYLGLVEKNLNNPKKALNYFQKCTSQFVPYQLYLHIGSLHLPLGHPKKARTALKNFLAQGPALQNEKQARYLLGVIAIKQGNLDEAQKAVNKLINIDKDYQKAYILKGEVYQAQGKFQQAISAFQTALNIINRKLALINSRLKQGEMSVDRYNQLRSTKKSLTEQRNKVKKNLSELRKPTN